MGGVTLGTGTVTATIYPHQVKTVYQRIPKHTHEQLKQDCLPAAHNLQHHARLTNPGSNSGPSGIDANCCAICSRPLLERTSKLEMICNLLFPQHPMADLRVHPRGGTALFDVLYTTQLSGRRLLQVPPQRKRGGAKRKGGGDGKGHGLKCNAKFIKSSGRLFSCLGSRQLLRGEVVSRRRPGIHPSRKKKLVSHAPRLSKADIVRVLRNNSERVKSLSTTSDCVST